MKKLVYLFTFLTMLIACKSNDKAAPDYMNFMGGNSGAWYLKETEVSTVDNKTKWEPITPNMADTLVFRSDGVILQADGKPRCCAPKSLIINGSLIDIVPQSPITPNPLCALLNCVYCPVWEITQTENEMIIQSCNLARRRYVR